MAIQLVSRNCSAFFATSSFPVSSVSHIIYRPIKCMSRACCCLLLFTYCYWALRRYGRLVYYLQLRISLIRTAASSSTFPELLGNYQQCQIPSQIGCLLEPTLENTLSRARIFSWRSQSTELIFASTEWKSYQKSDTRSMKLYWGSPNRAAFDKRKRWKFQL